MYKRQIINYSDIKKFQNQIISDFIEKKIDLFIGIDSPDFNFGIHKKLQKNGIKTVQVVCPSVWAWRSGRVKNFKFIDYMLCLFPFELDYCANVRKKAFYVGHPLAEKQHEYIGENKEDIICELKLIYFHNKQAITFCKPTIYDVNK